jgi:hypothetical protein
MAWLTPVAARYTQMETLADSAVMPGLVPDIHVFLLFGDTKERRGWPGTSPAMTNVGD